MSSNQEEITHFETLITTAELAANLDNPNWLVFDCRFDLSKPDWGFKEYLKRHISGSGYANLNTDLSAPATPLSGRHPLPALEKFVDTLQSWGVQPDSQVVVYDTVNGSYAARLWWMLRWAGLNHAAVLDGGFQKWAAEGRQVAAGVEGKATVHWEQRPESRPWMAVSIEEVERMRHHPNYLLVDARSPDRFRGENETLDPVPGHIPGAINRFYGENLQTDGQMKPVQQLRNEYELLLGQVTPEHTVLYCGSGVTSAHDLLAMEAAGLKGAKIYIGSWSEWCRQPETEKA